MQPCQGAAVNSNHFMDDRFMNLGEEVNSEFAVDNLALLNQQLYVLLLV